MRYFIICIITSLAFTQVACGQDNKTGTIDIGGGRTLTLIGGSNNESKLKGMKLKYTKPDGSKEVHKSECFNDNDKLRAMLLCLYFIGVSIHMWVHFFCKRKTWGLFACHSFIPIKQKEN